jgi:hypothetical protein
MTPTFRARTRLVDVLTLISVVLLIAATTFAWVDTRSRLRQVNRSLDAVTARLTALESKGASTTIFQFPEVRGSPYINLDQKGYDLSTPEPSNGQGKIRTPSGASKKGG